MRDARSSPIASGWPCQSTSSHVAAGVADERAHPLAGALDVVGVRRVGAHRRDAEELRELVEPRFGHARETTAPQMLAPGQRRVRRGRVTNSNAARSTRYDARRGERADAPADPVRQEPGDECRGPESLPATDTNPNEVPSAITIGRLVLDCVVNPSVTAAFAIVKVSRGAEAEREDVDGRSSCPARWASMPNDPVSASE